jgi:hypothetical protein
MKHLVSHSRPAILSPAALSLCVATLTCGLILAPVLARPAFAQAPAATGQETPPPPAEPKPQPGSEPPKAEPKKDETPAAPPEKKAETPPAPPDKKAETPPAPPEQKPAMPSEQKPETPAATPAPTAPEPADELTTLQGMSDRELAKRLLAFSRACSYGDIYEACGVNMDDPATEEPLSHVPPPDMKVRLERFRKSYPNPATWQNVAVCFTLAYFKIDYAANLRALLRPYQEEMALYGGARTASAATRQWLAFQKQAGHSLFETLALPNLLLRLYERNSDVAVLRQILAMRGIGGLAEAAAVAQTSLLLNKPRVVVEALAKDRPAMVSLGRFVSPTMVRNDYFKVLKAVGDLAGDPEYPDRAAAARLLQALKTGRSAVPRVTGE